MKQKIFTILKIYISGGLIYFLFARIGVNNLIDQFISANIYWILAGASVFTLGHILGAYQWYLLLKSKSIDLSFWRVIKFYYVGLFFNNFLLGYVGGDAFKIYDVKKDTGNVSGTFATVFFDRFIGFLAISSLALFATIIWVKKVDSYAIIYITLIIFAVWAVGFYFLFHEKATKKFSWPFRIILPKVAYKKLKEIYFELNSFKHSKILLLQIFVIDIVAQSFKILRHCCTALSVGVNIKVFYFFIFVPIISIVASLPISLGGIGVREQSGIMLFTQIGVLPAKIVAFEVIAYIVGIIITIPGAFFFIFNKKRK